MDAAKQNQIYDSIKKLISVYSPPYRVEEGKNVSNKDSYSLIATEKHEVNGKLRDVWFAGLIKQKGYVGFYFMPIYCVPGEVEHAISPRLQKALKGKSCFWIKDDSPETLADIKNALAEGFKVFEKHGWL